MQLSAYHWQVWWSYWGTSNWLVLWSNENLWLNSTKFNPAQSATQCALEWYIYQDNECTLRYPQYGSRFLQNEKNENNIKTFLTKPLMVFFFFTFRACLFYRPNIKMKSPTQPFWHYRFLNNRGWCYKCATGKEKHFIVRQREQRTKINRLSVQHSSQPIYTAVGSLIQFA